MYCSNCGSELEAGSQFCNTCGKLVSANLKEIKLINIPSLIRVLTPICFVLMFLYNFCVMVYTAEKEIPAFTGWSDYTAQSLLFGALYMILFVIAGALYNFLAQKMGGISLELSE